MRWRDRYPGVSLSADVRVGGDAETVVVYLGLHGVRDPKALTSPA